MPDSIINHLKWVRMCRTMIKLWNIRFLITLSICVARCFVYQKICVIWFFPSSWTSDGLQEVDEWLISSKISFYPSILFWEKRFVRLTADLDIRVTSVLQTARQLSNTTPNYKSFWHQRSFKWSFRRNSQWYHQINSKTFGHWISS